ncbi:MAG: DHHA1 domain-containing protein, partial [Panacagrimonas sp.]
SGVKVLAAKVDGVAGKEMRGLLDQLKDKMRSGVILLGAANGDKVSLIAGVTPDLIDKLKAGELVNFAAAQVGGKGGGKPEMAQAGGSDPSKLGEAIDSVYGWVESKL